MSDMKCPICGCDIQYNSSYSTYDCKNNPAEHYASEELWQELIRTRKALDFAVDTLKGIDWCAQDYAIAQEALAKITALEQKDK